MGIISALEEKDDELDLQQGSKRPRSAPVFSSDLVLFAVAHVGVSELHIDCGSCSTQHRWWDLVQFCGAGWVRLVKVRSIALARVSGGHKKSAQKQQGST